jgi:hypothetical protein
MQMVFDNVRLETGYSADKVAENFNSATVVGNVVRWNSNDRVPFGDMLNDFRTLGLIDDTTVEASNKARVVDTDKFLAVYRKAQALRTDEQIAEERYEARAAHGAGVELVNVITGERIVT